MRPFTRRRLLQLAASGAAWWGTGCTEPAPSRVPADGSAVTPTNMDTAASGNGEAQTKSLRIALFTLPTTLDPALFEIIEAYPFGFAVYDGLVWVDEQLVPQPMLAESWEAAPDQRSWSFKLRPDVTFHHGSPLRAQDVVFTVERLLNPELGSVLQPVLSFIDLVEAVDDHTVRFQLKAPNADLPLLLAAPQTRILASDYPVEQLLTQPSGTGPFRFVEQIAGSHIAYVRNADYWDAAQIQLDELVHLQLASFDEQVNALVQGQVDLILDVPIQHIDALNEHPETTVVETKSGRYQNLAMRVIEPPFDDVRVRQALKACLDNGVLQQKILQERGEVGYNHPLASISPLFVAQPAQPADPTQARQWLEEAGHADGLQLQLITADVAPGMVDLAYAVQAMAQDAGITIEVIEVKVSSDIYFSQYWGRVPFYVSAWEFRPSAYETFAVAYQSESPWNETGWSSPDLDDLLAQAGSNADPAKRQELYHQATELLAKDGAVVIPYFQPTIVAQRNHVQGFRPHPAGWVDLRGVTIAGS
ncbi:MAG: ABC transporter substrate-binding protein [Caldilineaceae bacterium]